MKGTDCLAFGPHPDDVELFCSGVLIKLKEQGYSTGIIDLTRGELSTNGDIDTRLNEAEKARQILELDIRTNLGLKDGSIDSTWDNRQKVIKTIRSLRPKICILPYWEDRHPDHESASALLKRAIFDSGLSKIDTGQEAFRPNTILYYMMHYFVKPTFVVDISEQMDQKLESINAYQSQFFTSTMKGIRTHINHPDFLDSIITRAKFLGDQIGVSYAEGFYYPGTLKIDNIINVFS